jgi:hypothetical protein
MWRPTAKRLVVKVAVPLMCGTGMGMFPSMMKATEPVGVLLSWAVTTAVNVTDWPATAGLADALNEVVVPTRGLTVCFIMSALGAKVPLPRYVARMV